MRYSRRRRGKSARRRFRRLQHEVLESRRMLSSVARVRLHVAEDVPPDEVVGVGRQDVTHVRPGDTLRLELYVQDLGWVGFDAANECCPDERYIRVGAGLDAHDAAPIRGISLGAGEESMDIQVSVAAQQ